MKHQHASTIPDARRMRAEGLTDAAIARKLGTSRQRIHALLGPSGRPTREPKAKPPDALDGSGFSDALRAFKARHGLATQEQVAPVFGVSQSTIARWESGHQLPAVAGALTLYLWLLDQPQNADTLKWLIGKN